MAAKKKKRGRKLSYVIERKKNTKMEKKRSDRQEECKGWTKSNCDRKGKRK